MPKYRIEPRHLRLKGKFLVDRLTKLEDAINVLRDDIAWNFNHGRVFHDRCSFVILSFSSKK